MRAVFVGASNTTQAAAALLLQRGHEVVIIERDKEKIDSLSQELDCGYLHGSGSKLGVLREADPENTDRLFCLTDDDQANILASLVGRSLGYKHVVCKIQDPELIHLCVELGLEDVIIPSQTIARSLAGMFEGEDPVDLSARIHGNARLFSFMVDADAAGPLKDLDLPKGTRIVCFYRADEFKLPDDRTSLQAGDEIILIAQNSSYEKLVDRWGAQPGLRR